MPKSVLKNSINKNTHLVAYNKEEIKQLGTCVLKVIYGGKTLPQEFFVVGSRFKPIVGLDASCRLGLLTVNCPVYQSWTRNKPIDSISGADADIPKMISKDRIVNNPKYKHLFQGIGRFKCDQAHTKCHPCPKITLKGAASSEGPVQARAGQHGFTKYSQ